MRIAGALVLAMALAACQPNVATTPKPDKSEKPATTVAAYTPPPGEAVDWKLLTAKTNVPPGLRIRAAEDLPDTLKNDADVRDTDFKTYELVTLQDPVHGCLGWPDDMDATYERVIWFVDTGERIEYGLQAKKSGKKFALLCKPAIATLAIRLPRGDKPITTTGGTPLKDPSAPSPSPTPTTRPSPTDAPNPVKTG